MRLVRVAQNDVATYGALVQGATPFAVTLELPWRNNERGVSCIPAGSYICRRVKSPKFGDTFEVTGVPGRAAILFHRGNIDLDTHGCVCVGEAFNPVLSKPGITDSSHGFAEFLNVLRMTEQFPLLVELAFPKTSPHEPLKSPA